MRLIYFLLEFIKPTFEAKGRASALKITAFVAFVNINIAFWFFYIFDKAVPEYIFLAFSGIVLGMLGLNNYRKDDI